MDKRVFSGIQPTGDFHIGNYLGAMRQWVKGQNDGLNIFCIVDLHSITVPQNAQYLHKKTLEAAALILAAGVDPKKSILFVQSHNPDHANLAWVLNCFASMGQMERMTQFKEKKEGKEFVSVGLFDYPALMAADILLYDTSEVPIGDDQKQHVELTRDLAERFNSKYGNSFTLPEPKIPTMGARIMSLQDPTKKMSKSDLNPNATIFLLDSEENIRKKIGSAVTDSDGKVVRSPEKPGITNLIEIYSAFSGISPEEVEEKFVGKNYGEFKSAVADEVIKGLTPLQEKYHELHDTGELTSILVDGAERAREISHIKLLEIYEKIGFVTK